MPPSGYLVADEDYYDPISTTSKTLGNKAMNPLGANEPTFVKAGLPPKVIL
jgi:hypothetical protein